MNQHRLAATSATVLTVLLLTSTRQVLAAAAKGQPPQNADRREAAASSAASPAKLYEGRFSQCSYNAVGSALSFFYGPNGPIVDVHQFEESVFVAPLTATGFGPYYGWGPWTSYMVESGKMVWNGHPVREIQSKRFALRPAALPEVKGRLIVVHYAAGERDHLRGELLEQLRRGPVVMWTPYAAALDRGSGAAPWHHVSRLDEQTDAVLFGRFTHSVALFLEAPKPVRDDPAPHSIVTDCSVARGVFVTDLDTLVSTSAAMTAFVRIKADGGKSMLERGFSGVSDDAYNVVFFRSLPNDPTSRAASVSGAE